MKYSHILIDMDGTIVDSAPGIIGTLEQTFKHFEIDYVREDLYKLIGPPLSENMAKYIKPGHNQEDYIKKYRELFDKNGIYANSLYPGIKEFLIKVYESGRKLYIASSKRVDYSEKILSHHDILKYFTFIWGDNTQGTMGEKSKIINYILSERAIEKNSALMIGDRSYDIHGANANGIDSVGVLYGYGSKEELVDSGAHYIAESAEDIYKIITGN